MVTLNNNVPVNEVPLTSRDSIVSSLRNKETVVQPEKEAARAERNNDKVSAQNGTCHTMCCDFMAVQYFPSIIASASYYKLKLTAHNFTVYNMESHDAMACWFDETRVSLFASTFAYWLCDYVSELFEKSLQTVIGHFIII